MTIGIKVNVNRYLRDYSQTVYQNGLTSTTLIDHFVLTFSDLFVSAE